MLSNNSIPLSQQLAGRFRKTALFSFHIFACISLQYLGRKRKKAYTFPKTHRKGYALGPYICVNLHSLGGWYALKEKIDGIGNYNRVPFLLHTDFNITHLGSCTSSNKSQHCKDGWSDLRK